MRAIPALLLVLLRRVNLWPRLVIAVSLGFLALFAVLSLLTLRIVQASTNRVLQERLVITQMATREVDALLERAFSELEMAVASARRPSEAELSAELGKLAGQVGRATTLWLGFYLLDSQGLVIAAEPEGRRATGTNLLETSHIRQVMATGERSISTPFLDHLTGKPAAALTVPVRMAQGGSAFMLGGVIDLSRPEFQRPLNTALELGETFHAELVDSGGFVCASTETGGFRQPGEHLEFYLRMLEKGAQGVETVPYQPWNPAEGQRAGEKHVMAFAPLSMAPWGLSLGGNRSETFAAVTGLRNQILLIGALSLVVLWIVTLAGARLLVRPVKVLTSAAGRIARGDLESSIRLVEGGEIGRLAEALETMRMKLKTSLEEIARWGRELEAKVRERTEELEARNRQLLAVTGVATAANESRDLHQMLERCLGIILEDTGAAAGAIRLLERERAELVAACHLGPLEAFACRDRVPSGDQRPCSHVAMTGEPLTGYGAELPGAAACLAPGAQYMAVLPLRSAKGVQGVLCVAPRDPRSLDGGQMEMLTAICNQIGVAIENAQLLQDLSKMEAQRELDRLKSEFMSTISHELRTPLGFIKGYVTTLLREDLAADRQTQREFLEIISDESDKLQRLIDDLLDASRLQAGGLKLSRTWAQVGRIAELVVEKARATFPGQPFALHRPPVEPDVFLDPWRIEQVLHNLVDNAVKYSPPGRAITLAVQLQGPEVVVSVKDQGDGISADDRWRVFEPFYRGENAIRRRTQGTGLGLTICRGIVEAHRGRIWVESRPRRGSTFSFALPLTADGRPGPPAKEPGEPAGRGARPRHRTRTLGGR